MTDVVPLYCIGRCCTLVDVVVIMMVWQMVSHRGRCYNFYGEQWQMLLPLWWYVADGKPLRWMLKPLCWNMADVIAELTDGMATWGFNFKLSSEVLNRTSSHIWGRWYLPMFLFRDGLLTLVYNASLMVLMRFRSSLPTMLTFSIVVVWSVVLEWSYIGEGPFWCSLNLSPNVLEDSPIYSSSHSTLSHICTWLHFSWAWDLYPWEPPEGFWWSCLI